PSNEIAAANWLREQGFRVHVSSQMTGNDPDRYWSTIWSATVTPLFKERTDSIITVCGDRLTGDAQVMGWGSIRDGFPEKSMSLVPWAMTDHLARKFAQTSDLLFCGLEKWL